MGGEAGKAGSSDAVGQAPRRRAPTIDLEATEVADPSTAAGESPTVDSSDPDSLAAAEPGNAARQHAERAGSRWVLLGAGLAGAAAASLVVLGLWFADLRVGDRALNPAVLAGKFAAVENELAALAARVAASAPAGQAQQLADVQTRLGELQGELKRLPQLEESEAALLGRVAAVENRLAAATEADRATPSRGVEQTAGDALAAIQSRVNGLADRVAALEQSTRQMGKQLSEFAGASDPAARLAVVALEIRSAVDRGVPFATELALAKHLGANREVMGPLEAVATTGVASPATLADSLAKLQSARTGAASAPAGDGGVLARLEASAARLVRIRRVEEIPAEDASAAIGRARIKAARADIAGALEEVEKLPEPAHASLSAWIVAARSQIAAAQAARELLASALGELVTTAH